MRTLNGISSRPGPHQHWPPAIFFKRYELQNGYAHTLLITLLGVCRCARDRSQSIGRLCCTDHMHSNDGTEEQESHNTNR